MLTDENDLSDRIYISIYFPNGRRIYTREQLRKTNDSWNEPYTIGNIPEQHQTRERLENT